MFKLCNFCLEKVTAKDAVSVRELVIDKSPGIIKFCEVLKDVSLTFTTLPELICERCLDRVMDFFKFKENLSHMQFDTKISEQTRETVKSDVELKVSEFLAQTQEEVSITSYHSSLCLVPKSNLKLMKHLIDLSPAIYLSRNSLNEELEISDIYVVTELKSPDYDFENGKVEKPEDEISKEENFDVRKPKNSKRFRQTSMKNWRLNDIAKHKLSKNEIVFLEEQMKCSKISEDLYNCSQCSKILHSFTACRYHLVCKHIKSRDPSKDWFLEKIKEGQEGRAKFTCVYCTKSYTTAPGLRYHLKLHLEDECMPTRTE